MALDSLCLQTQRRARTKVRSRWDADWGHNSDAAEGVAGVLRAEVDFSVEASQSPRQSECTADGASAQDD